MKIALVGAHRVGKTTLAEKLRESLPGYNFKPEPYYDMEEAGHLFSELPNVDDYLEQLEYSFDQISKSGNKVIFDRCPIDLLAYIQAMNNSEMAQSLYHKVQRGVTGIDLLVLVPIEEPDLIGCPESEFPELRYQVNEILNEWVWDFDIETIEVKGTLLARRDHILDKMAQEQRRLCPPGAR